MQEKKEDKNTTEVDEEKKEEIVIKKEEKSDSEEEFFDGKEIEELLEEEDLKKQSKDYLAIIILLVGAFLGSLFVDVSQLLSKQGYSVKALKSAEVFSLNDKTWVAYEEPIVNLSILTVSEDNLKDCPTCKVPEEVTSLFKKVIPTLVIKEVDIESEEGKKIMKENNVKVLPAMVFSNDVEKTEFYNGEAKVLFTKVSDNGNYALNLSVP